MQIFVNTNYNFVRWRFHALAFSLVFLIVGFSLFATRGVNLGIDFAGGANIVLKFQDEISVAQLRRLVPEATIQQYGKQEEHSMLIRLPQAKVEKDYAGAKVAELHAALNPNVGGKLDLNYSGRDALADLLRSADPDKKGTGLEAQAYYQNLAEQVISRRSGLGIFHNFNEVTSVPGVTSSTATLLSERAALGRFNVLSQETVGPRVGKELQTKALVAVILSALAMGVYITLRFDLKFGFAAVVCIVHDVLLALAFLAMINGEFDLNIVAALLLIVGYSINDTVVTYDRVRENQRKTRVKSDYPAQLNLAMNQTLSRTVLTSGSTLLVLIALLLFGGKVIHDFAWILTVGVLAGTYSTVTIVPAVAIAWDRYLSKASRSQSRPRTESARPQTPAAKIGGKRAKG